MAKVHTFGEGYPDIIELEPGEMSPEVRKAISAAKSNPYRIADLDAASRRAAAVHKELMEQADEQADVDPATLARFRAAVAERKHISLTLAHQQVGGTYGTFRSGASRSRRETSAIGHTEVALYRDGSLEPVGTVGESPGIVMRKLGTEYHVKRGQRNLVIVTGHRRGKQVRRRDVRTYILGEEENPAIEWRESEVAGLQAEAFPEHCPPDASNRGMATQGALFRRKATPEQRRRGLR